MQKNHDLEKLKKILESCHINFLIGSGASRNYLATLNNIENLLSSIENMTNKFPEKEEYKIVEASIKYKYFKDAIEGNLGLVDPVFVGGKTEELEETKLNYSKFLAAVNKILIKRKTRILNRQVNLFTTNIDLFLDCILESEHLEFNDGFTGKITPFFSTSNYNKSTFKSSAHYDNWTELPAFNLFKLHGSVNWRKTRDEKITYDYQLGTLKRLDQLQLKKKDFLDIKKGASIKSLITMAEGKSVSQKLENFLLIYNDLLMVNPTKEKFRLTTIDYNFYEQLRMFSNSLEKENSVLFTTGFSFADEHIREITQRVSLSNPTLLIYVFCFSEEDKLNLEQYFPLNKYRNVFCRSFEDRPFSFGDIVDHIFEPIANELDRDHNTIGQFCQNSNKD